MKPPRLTELLSSPDRLRSRAERSSAEDPQKDDRTAAAVVADSEAPAAPVDED